MCLAVPAQVISLNEEASRAWVGLNGMKVDVSLALVDDVKVGDYVLIHVGFALEKLNEQEALDTLSAIGRLSELPV